MFPISYLRTLDGKKVTFKYDEKEWEDWDSRGKKFGDVGMVMTSIEGNFVTYSGYGTIEHPFTSMHTLQLVHNPIFDGRELQEPEYYLKPLAEERARKYWEDMHKNMRLTFLDFDKPETNE